MTCRRQPAKKYNNNNKWNAKAQTQTKSLPLWFVMVRSGWMVHCALLFISISRNCSIRSSYFLDSFRTNYSAACSDWWYIDIFLVDDIVVEQRRFTRASFLPGQGVFNADNGFFFHHCSPNWIDNICVVVGSVRVLTMMYFHHEQCARYEPWLYHCMPLPNSH